MPPQKGKIKMKEYNYRFPLCAVELSSSYLSPDRTPWIHCVEAKKSYGGAYPLGRIRIIADRPMNITVPLRTEEQRKRFDELRFFVRNSDYVAVNFETILVRPSSHRRNELYLFAYDFTYRKDSVKKE